MEYINLVCIVGTGAAIWGVLMQHQSCIILYNKKITMYMNILSHEIPSAERRYPGSQ